MKQPNGRFRPAVVAAAVLEVALLAAAAVSEVVFHESIDPTEQGLAMTAHNSGSAANVAGTFVAFALAFIVVAAGGQPCCVRFGDSEMVVVR
jgi:hypothetical protein